MSPRYALLQFRLMACALQVTSRLPIALLARRQEVDLAANDHVSWDAAQQLILALVLAMMVDMVESSVSITCSVL
jgi:hypothetical protein